MIPDLLRHQLAALVRRAVIRTAASSHFRHNFTGRAPRAPANDAQPFGNRTGLGEAAPSLVASPMIFTPVHGALNA